MAFVWRLFEFVNAGFGQKHKTLFLAAKTPGNGASTPTLGKLDLIHRPPKDPPKAFCSYRVYTDVKKTFKKLKIKLDKRVAIHDNLNIQFFYLTLGS